MDNRETQCSALAIVLALLGGAAVGVVAGLLLAPKPGKETRRALKGYAKRTEEEVLEKAKEARAAQAFARRGDHVALRAAGVHDERI